MNDKEKTVADLVAGDLVWCSGYGSTGKICLVERRTNTQLLVGGSRYRRKDGEAVGERTAWNRSYIRPATQKDLEQHQVRVAQHRLGRVKVTPATLQATKDFLEVAERLQNGN